MISNQINLQQQNFDTIGYDKMINLKIPNDNSKLIGTTTTMNKNTTSTITATTATTTNNNTNNNELYVNNTIIMNNNNNNNNNCKNNSQNLTKEKKYILPNSLMYSQEQQIQSSSQLILSSPITTTAIIQKQDEIHEDELAIVRGDRLIQDIHNYSQLSNNNNNNKKKNLNNENLNNDNETEEDDYDEFVNKMKPLNDDEKTPAHHARRPMNAFLIFCKRHRAIVREKYPNLENRSITKILGDWWANLETEEKICYTNLAKTYKDAFFSANPNFKWYKLPAPPLRTLTTRPSNAERPLIGNQIYSGHQTTSVTQNTNNRTKMYIDWSNDGEQREVDEEEELQEQQNTQFDIIKPVQQKIVGTQQSSVGVFKLADEAQMGGLNSLMMSCEMKGKIGINNLNNNNNNIGMDNGVEQLPNNNNNNNNIINNNNNSNNLNTRRENLNKDEALHNALSETSNYFVNTMIPAVKRCSTEPFSNMKDHAAKMQSDSIKNKINKSNNSIVINKRKLTTTTAVTPGAASNNLVFDDCYKKRKILQIDVEEKKIIKEKEIPMKIETCNLNVIEQKPLMYVESTDDELNNKKSSRACKGKRYQEFMTIGKINPINKKIKTNKIISTPIGFPHNGYCKTFDVSSSTTSSSQKYYDYNHLVMQNQHTTTKPEFDEAQKKLNACNKTYDASDFELEEKIKALPSLSLEKYLARKRETKKKKKINNKCKNLPTSSQSISAFPQTIYEVREKLQNSMVGSQKRKARKESITRRDVLVINDNNNTVYDQQQLHGSFNQGNGRHPEPQSHVGPSTVTSDLFILATIAESEANKTKNTNIIS